MLTELADGLRLEGVFLKLMFKIRPKKIGSSVLNFKDARSLDSN
jgi:hypothetical protein